MTMFDIYVEEFEIEDSKGNVEKYRIKPLTGKYLPKMYDIVSRMGDAENVDISMFDEKTVSMIHELCLESFKKSYPNEPEDLLNAFVSQNLMVIMAAVFKVNMRVKQEG
jgi:hypothetical protein